ncbi:MAG: hypothetical protein ABI325_06595 [Ginsengibacter sp.]
MKNYEKHIIFLIVLIIGINVSPVNAQEIKGDTIFVNAEAEVLVRFPTLPDFFNTIPSNAPYNFKTAGTGFTVIAKTENTKPAPLTVSEGGRTHHFILVFKKNINYDNDAELDYDYSTVKKLEQHIKETGSGSGMKTEIAKGNDPKGKAGKASGSDQNKTSGYYALLEDGENNYKQQLYQQAKLNFEKALALRPDDILPKQMIEKVTLKIAEQEKAVEQEKNKKYVALTSQAKTNLDIKKYAEAKEGYNQALQLRPGDLYATHQIEKIDKILQEETGKKEQEKLKSLYESYIAAGEKALNQNLLTDARIAFQQALVIKKNDPGATSRIQLIDEKEKKNKEKTELENNYANAVQSADQFFQKGDYDNAKIQYNKAYDLIKRPWPQEQLKNIDKMIADRTAKEIAEKQNLALQAQAEKKEQESQGIENTYKVLVQSADSLFKAGNYANAKIKYMTAADVINRPWPKEQIVKINSILQDVALKEKTKKEKQIQQELNEKRIRENQEIENRYDSAIQLADRFFTDSDYNNARSAYNKAIEFIKKPWPESQIKKINQILVQQSEQEKTEKLIQAQQASITSKYLADIRKADIEFGKGNYANSRKLYMDAVALKPDEKHPRDRLLEIQNTLDKITSEEKRKKDSITAVLETKKKYDLAISIAKSYYLKGDLLNAKTAYLEAMNVKPTEAEPKNQLSLINKKLEDMAKEKEIDNKYENIIAVADSQLIAKAFEPALTAYNVALEIKPSETYPKSQIKFIQTEIKNIQIEAEEKKKIEAELKEQQLENDYRNSISIADKAMKDKKFDEAKSAYSKALKIQPDNDYAMQRFKIASYQYELQKKSVDNNSTAINNNTANAEKKSKKDSKNKIENKELESILHSAYTYQANPIPYTKEELESKYPDIDFFNIPTAQPFNETFVKSEDHQTIFKKVLSEQPRLTLSSTDDKIKLICVGISFEESLVYLKFILQNNSKKDFLTGPMMLTWTRKNGNRIKLYPLYLFPANLPILKPGNETAIIYVCKSYIIIDQEELKFEMTDRFDKTKLQIAFPGSVYNKEMDRGYY